MQNLSLGRLALVFAALAACDPALPVPGASSVGGGGEGGGALVVTTDPPAPLASAPRALRLRIDGGGAIDPATLALVEGPVGPGQLRDIAAQTPSAALSARIVPALAFREGAAVVLAPTVLLEAGAAYTLAIGSLQERIPVTIAKDDPVPILRRLWPPLDTPGPVAAAVWCGEVPLPPIDVAATLAPDGPSGWLRRGALPRGGGQRCVRFEAAAVGPHAKHGDAEHGDAEHGEGAWVPPPLVIAGADPSLPLRLSPEPIRVGPAGSTVPVLGCEADEITFGPGCARVADDRLAARSPAAPLLWAVAGAGVDSVLTTAAGDPFTITGLPPTTESTLDVGVVDARGTVLRMLVTAVTSAPMPHVVLNEVLANPLGPEPVAEWVEIVNDGRIPVDVGGYVLSDGGGETVLPSARLAPGAYALLVNTDFDALADPVPAPHTPILRVPHLGKNGLANAGEALVLRDAGGAVLSRFPALPKPKAGESVGRLTPAAPDQLPTSFARAAPSPGRANTW